MVEAVENTEANCSITLTETESKIFETLLSIVEEHKLDTTLRVAGGWVRDKLLGKESDDIDIALDNMLGGDFAKLVDQRVNAEASAASDEHQYKKTYGAIKANKDKAKHLEIANATLHGHTLDLVNLTNESFHSAVTEGDESNVFGTAEQDALRRDCTINALFYNINEGKIEDFTGKGLSDIRAEVIRTPFEPL